MKPKKKLSLLLGIILLISIISIAVIIAATPAKHRKIAIKTVRSKKLSQTVTVEGVVEPNKKQAIYLDTAQKVLEVLAAEGQEVKKGDTILKLDSSDNQYRLRIEEINLKLAERNLAKVLNDEDLYRKELEHAYKQAELAAAAAKAELESSQKALQKDKQLFEKDAISGSQYETSQENLKAKENAVILRSMELERASESLSGFDQDKEEQIYKLKSNINVIHESINNLKAKLDADTRANIDGKVVKLEVEGGQYPSSDSSEILIYDMSKYIVKIELKQQEALYIKEGMKAKIKIKGMDGKEYTGTVAEVDQVAASSKSEGKGNKIEVKLTIDNPDEMLKIGYEVEVKIDLSMKDDAIVVDFEAIIKDTDGKKYIYFVENDMARRRIVSTGIETSFEVEITEGIIPGDSYVVNPPEEMLEKSSMKIWGWRYVSK